MLELSGNLLVGHGCCLCAMPGAAIRVDLGIGRFRERSVDLAPLVRSCCPVHSRAHEWMTEHDSGVEGDQAVRLGGVRGRLRDSEALGGAPLERGVAGRIGRRHEQQPPRVTRQPCEPPREALLDPSGER